MPLAPAAASIAILAALLVATPASATPSTVDRVAGADRFESAVLLSRSFSPGSPVVYVTNAGNFPDALAAAPAAAVGRGPVLLTLPDQIPGVVAAELSRIAPSKIVVVGGTDAVGDAVFRQLQQYSPIVTRFAGADRFETSRDVALDVFPHPSRVYIATGYNFPDALSAGAAAATRGAPVLLVKGTNTVVDLGTYVTIRILDPADIVVVGGASAVSDAFLSSLREIGKPVTRLAGSDRYDTSRVVNHDTFPRASHVFLATGLNFPDALAGSAYAGLYGAPLYVVPGNCVTQAVRDEIESTGASRVTILGGENAVGSPVDSLTVCGSAPPTSPPTT